MTQPFTSLGLHDYNYDDLQTMLGGIFDSAIARDWSCHPLIVSLPGMGKSHALNCSIEEAAKKANLTSIEWTPSLPLNSSSINNKSFISTRLLADRLNENILESLIKSLPLLSQSAGVFIVIEDLPTLPPALSGLVASLMDTRLTNVVVSSTANLSELQNVDERIKSRCSIFALSQNPAAQKRASIDSLQLSLSAKRDALGFNKADETINKTGAPKL